MSGEGVFPIQHHEADGCLTAVQSCCLGFKRGLVLILETDVSYVRTQKEAEDFRPRDDS